MNIFNFKRNKKNEHGVEVINEESNNRQTILELKKEKINLRKEKINTICLTKKEFINIEKTKFDVVVVLDCSGSTSNLFKNGTIQNILEKLLPISLKFDDDGELDVWLFNTSAYQFKSINMDNFFNYVEKENLYSEVGGGTYYSPVIKEIISKKIEKEKTNNPVYVIFITDGDNFDKKETKQVIIEASNKPIFWQFVGIGKEKFEFLETLDTMTGREVDNANFFSVNNIEVIEESELYEKVMKELPIWFKEIDRKRIL
ncbi:MULTISPECIES: VWA domain-containing protein [unclassified Clostridioides]|uniref:VWA domain-containing protein n=1 Tax=unclassified Clostridioides TaxID=2635829 RepID=UPI001D120659|nr:VWA domain-containing protein [Clostridioides sp. ZZV14-6048]MCC0740005.1 VWA domain-containing protein [Clostridioides sp. ZZV14-5902]